MTAKKIVDSFVSPQTITNLQPYLTNPKSEKIRCNIFSFWGSNLFCLWAGSLMKYHIFTKFCLLFSATLWLRSIFSRGGRRTCDPFRRTCRPPSWTLPARHCSHCYLNNRRSLCSCNKYKPISILLLYWSITFYGKLYEGNEWEKYFIR